MKVLVTGGAGFIGSNFVNRYSEGLYPQIKQIHVLDALTYAGNYENIRNAIESKKVFFQKGNICEKSDIADLIPEFDAVINFAAESHVDNSIKNPSDFLKTNVMGLHEILNVILKSKKKIRLIHISTDEVYGSIKEGSWSENSILLPNSPYAASKAGGELILRSYVKTFGLDLLVTRCSNNYGPYQFPEKLIPRFVTNVLSNKKVSLYGDGKNIRDWLHVYDHCDAIYQVLLNGDSGEIYNIGGGMELSNLELTHIIFAIMKIDSSQIEFVEDRKGHDFRYSVDWKKIRDNIGYSPKVDFKSGIIDTIDWYRKNESWWKPLYKL